MSKIQFKTTIRYYYILIRMGKIKILKILNAGEYTEHLGFTHIVGGNIKWHSLSGK